MPSKSKTKFMIKTDIHKAASGTSTTTVPWGNITGTLTNQTDLAEPISIVNTDADYTESFVANKVIRHTGTLTADRTVTLPTGVDNAKMYYTRTGAGAFNLDIGGLKNLTTNTWCVIRYRALSASWSLYQYGTL